VVVGAVLGVYGSYVGADRGATAAVEGARIGAENAREIQDREQAATLDKESRDKRGEVYAKLLRDANAFFYASLRLYDAQEVARTSGRPVPGSVTSTWQSARFDYQGSINAVFVYGSDQAWALVNEIVDPVSPAATTEIPQLSKDDVERSKQQFNAGYRAFQRQLCREVPARPRSCAS
jgi:hypothetical protein